MAVRNFWIECDIDGRATTLSGGPRSKESGMSVKLFIRDRGKILEALNIDCFAVGDELIINVYQDGRNIETIRTTR